MEDTEVILRLNSLAVQLHRALTVQGRNIFVSPVSVSAALVMLQRGVVGKAATELKDVIGNDGNTLGQLLRSPPQDCTIANALFAQNDFTIKQAYLDELAMNFGAQVNVTDFRMESERAVSKINEWAQEKTNGAIRRLVESIDKETVLILLNAVYFKGTWKHKFDTQKTVPQNFYCKGLEDNPKLVNMMNIKENFPFVEEENFQALKLPYEGDEVAMIVFLPRSVNGLQALEDQLKSSFIQDLEQLWRKRKVEVSLPKFRVEFSANLNEPLQNMGVKRIFEWSSELSGISDCGQLRVSEVRQKAVLVIDEEGCEAAAATAIAIQKRSRPVIKQFVVDRPFFFVIYDTRNNLVLFMGRVEDL